MVGSEGEYFGFQVRPEKEYRSYDAKTLALGGVVLSFGIVKGAAEETYWSENIFGVALPQDTADLSIVCVGVEHTYGNPCFGKERIGGLASFCRSVSKEAICAWRRSKLSGASLRRRLLRGWGLLRGLYRTVGRRCTCLGRTSCRFSSSGVTVPLWR